MMAHRVFRAQQGLKVSKEQRALSDLKEKQDCGALRVI
jgi:hypothetical protein